MLIIQFSVVSLLFWCFLEYSSVRKYSAYTLSLEIVQNKKNGIKINPSPYNEEFWYA